MIMNIERQKNNLAKAYGTKPTICYYYYLWNVVDYCGEKRVRESFESIKGQGNEVIIGNYNPKDKTKKIAKEYGFKVVDVIKDKNYLFHESKIRNKVIFESKSNFLVPLNINVEYPKDLTRFIRRWLSDNDITKNALKLRYKFQMSNGKIRQKPYGFSYVFYRPYLINARGYNERTSYAAGSQLYGVMLLTDVYKLNTKTYDLGMIHKYHNNIKLPMMRKIFSNNNFSLIRLRRNRRNLVNFLMNNLKRNFKNGVRKTKNSYW